MHIVITCAIIELIAMEVFLQYECKKHERHQKVGVSFAIIRLLYRRLTKQTATLHMLFALANLVLMGRRRQKLVCCA